MKPFYQKTQSGFALLIFLMVLMGIGGVVLTGFSQGILKEVEAKKFQHNKRVLKEAKQALLQFAYNYPATNGNGPGRLPCPDTDNDVNGTIEFPPVCGPVGRLPWGDGRLNVPRLTDASGETLWYAVSAEFRNFAPAQLGANTNGNRVVNSDSVGTITIFDQTGNLVYDGTANGVAGVIIAPGTALAGQNRNTAADRLIPANYLDSFNTFDNSVFTNGSNADGAGFILGPITNNANNTLVVNDEIIVITTEEVVAMAEKATLQAYRDTINAYLAKTGNVYPWLYNYTGVPDVAGLSSFYPANASFATELGANLDNFGRIPSIFGNYFTDADSQPIESKLSGSLIMSYPLSPTVITHSGGGAPFLFNDGRQALRFQTVNELTNVKFVDIAGTDGQLTATVGTFEQFSRVTYFWDDGDSPTGIWTMCPAGADQLSDCNRDGAGNPAPGVIPNDKDAEILRITLTIDFNPGAVTFEANYTTPPVISPPVAASNLGHAQIAASFNGADVIFGTLPPLSAAFEIDDHYNSGDSTFNVSNSGMLDNVADLTLDSLTLGLRYYPEIPDWAFDNGWHNSVMMAYANNYRPDILGACTEADPLPANRCLTVNNVGGNIDDKISLLVIAGQHDWIDNGVAGLTDDVADVFDLENENLDDTFDVRATNGNDTILVINEF